MASGAGGGAAPPSRGGAGRGGGNSFILFWCPTRRRHRHGRSPHAPGEWGGVRYPPFFWLIWQHFPGTPVCMKSPPAGDGATAVASHLGQLTLAPVPREGAVTVSARPGRSPEMAPTIRGLPSAVLLPTHPSIRASAFLPEGQGMKGLWPGFFHMGEPAFLIGKGSGWSRVRAGRRRGFTPLPATYGCDGGGGARRPSDLSHPPDGA